MRCANTNRRDRAAPRALPPERPIAASLNFDPAHVGAIDASHQRCVALGLSRIERPDLGLVGPSELAYARERSQRLQRHAVPVMKLLCDQVTATRGMVVLTDAVGTVLQAIGDNAFLGRASQVALMPGAVWSEASKGTNAIGTALIDEQPTLVHADEHFLHANHFLTCSAAPILDPRGNVLGVLDVSGDQRSYHQHTMALVKMSARMIENQWLNGEYRGALRLLLHSQVEFIGTLVGGILAVDLDGRVVGANRGALEQIGASGAALRMQTLESLLGLSVTSLIDRFRTPQAPPVTVHVGARTLHLRAEIDGMPETASVWTTRPPRSSDCSGRNGNDPRTATTRPDVTSADVPQDAVVALVLERLVRGLEHGLPAVLQGETGSGRQWLARAAHHAVRAGCGFHVLSGRLAGPAEVDAAWSSLPGEELLPTVFVAEPGDLGEAAQVHLLHWLDSRDVLTRGGALICTTREPLRLLAERGRLHEALYYRINGLTLRVPPMRERSDSVALARRLVGSPARELAPDVCRLIETHRWPGNVRQLGNAMRAAVATAGDAAVIETRHLPDDLVDPAHPLTSVDWNASPTLALEDMEIELIRQTVRALGGNISEASKRLRISRNTIYRKLRWNDRDRGGRPPRDAPAG